MTPFGKTVTPRGRGWGSPRQVIRNGEMSDFVIRKTCAKDKGWIRRLMRERWAAEFVFVHGNIIRPDELPGFIAETGTKKSGLITYSMTAGNCEIVTLDSLVPNRGIGGALIESVRSAARDSGCRRLSVVTTNDNLRALRFYQRKGFTLSALRPNAMEAARKVKPIPPLGEDGIPIRDEIELEMMLE